MINWALMGDPNASLPDPAAGLLPADVRRAWARRCRPPASRSCRRRRIDGGVPEQLGLQRPDRCRCGTAVRSASSTWSATTPRPTIDVDPETYQVTVDGEPATIEPAQQAAADPAVLSWHDVPSTVGAAGQPAADRLGLPERLLHAVARAGGLRPGRAVDAVAVGDLLARPAASRRRARATPPRSRSPTAAARAGDWDAVVAIGPAAARLQARPRAARRRRTRTGASCSISPSGCRTRRRGPARRRWSRRGRDARACHAGRRRASCYAGGGRAGATRGRRRPVRVRRELRRRGPAAAAHRPPPGPGDRCARPRP